MEETLDELMDALTEGKLVVDNSAQRGLDEMQRDFSRTINSLDWVRENRSRQAQLKAKQ